MAAALNTRVNEDMNQVTVTLFLYWTGSDVFCHEPNFRSMSQVSDIISFLPRRE